MNDLNVIDSFMQAFITYIDSGFGLLGGDVSFLSRTLIALDITLAGLFWALGGEDNVLGRLIRKILYVGAFAFILNSFSTLSTIIFNSFAQAGLTAGGGTITAADLLKPGRLAGTGFSAAWPLLQQVNQYSGFTNVFANLLTIVVLLVAWIISPLSYPILRRAWFTPFSDIGRFGLPMHGKRCWRWPVSSWSSLMIAIAWLDSGTRCARRIFIFSMGMHHTALSTSISDHSACRSSPGRTNRCGDRRNAMRVTSWPVYPSIDLSRMPTSTGSMMAA